MLLEMENNFISIDFHVMFYDPFIDKITQRKIEDAIMSKTGQERFELIGKIKFKLIFNKPDLLEKIDIITNFDLECIADYLSMGEKRVSTSFNQINEILTIKLERPKLEIHEIVLTFIPKEPGSFPQIGRLICYSKKRDKRIKENNSKNVLLFPNGLLYEPLYNLPKQRNIQNKVEKQQNINDFLPLGSLYNNKLPVINEKKAIKPISYERNDKEKKENTVNGIYCVGGRYGNTFLKIIEEHIQKEYTNDGSTPFSDMFILNTAYIDPKVYNYQFIVGITKGLGAYIVDNMRFADYVISDNGKLDRSRALKAKYVFSSFMRENWENESLQNIEQYILPEL